VLTIDLTNRCNMMCDPCFMDANQVGFVHELSWDDIRTLLDNAVTIKPRRQMSVQFSGGEPTLSPHFLDAVRYAREVGYTSVQAATNGIEFAKSAEFWPAAARPGYATHICSSTGSATPPTNTARSATCSTSSCGPSRTCTPTGSISSRSSRLSTGSTTSKWGAIVQFALDNPKKIPFLSFQPVSFTGRDEAVTDERRAAQR